MTVPTSESLAAWVSAVRERHRPRVVAELCELAAKADALHRRLSELEADAGGERLLKQWRERVAAAVAELDALERRVSEAREREKFNLRAIVDRHLSEVGKLLRAHESEADRLALVTADEFLGPADDGAPHSERSPGELEVVLRHHPLLLAFRLIMNRRAEEAAAVLATRQQASDEADRLTADRDAMREEVDRVLADLRDGGKHWVDAEVLAEVRQRAVDPAFATFCRRREADTRLEAQWRSAWDVLRPFREANTLTLERLSGPRPRRPSAAVGRAAAPPPARPPLTSAELPAEFDWDTARRHFNRVGEEVAGADPKALPALMAEAAHLAERVRRLAAVAVTQSIGRADLHACANVVRQHASVGPLAIVTGTIDRRLAEVLAAFKPRLASEATEREFADALNGLTAAARDAAARGAAARADLDQLGKEKVALEAFGELLDTLLTGATGSGPETSP